MPTRVEVTPAFGQATLSNCEREQIHLAGSVQPHGALLILRESDEAIVQISENAADFLGIDFNPLGKTLRDIPGDLATRLRPTLSDPPSDMTRAVRCHAGPERRACDCLIHRPAGGGLAIELEPAGPSTDVSGQLEDALQAVMASATSQALCDETARIFKAITGYDRVMVYRFDDDGHGEVLSEAREPDLEPFLGNRYPATDIPQIARRLYERNRVRLLRDVEYTPAKLIPVLSPITGEHLDMSMCFLRSSSPIHVQYLKNMGVRGTLVVSLMVNGRLWGLVSCHHYVPRLIHFETRAVCELLAEAVATRIAALDSFAQAQAEFMVRRLEQQMIRGIARDGEWRGALFDRTATLLEPVGATGAALLFEGEVRTVGDVPGTAALRDIGTWLDRQPRGEVMATASFTRDAPEFADHKAIASGVLAVPISTSPGEYLVWLRPERIRTVTWGGDPNEPHLVGDDPSTLSPRRSFAQWHQVVEGTSDPWSNADLAAARLIGDSVTDVVVQFRSVRMLIAEDLLEQVRHQVQQAGSPVVITDSDGHILQINTAFDALLPPHSRRPTSLAELRTLFSGPEDSIRALVDLTRDRRAWRGEVQMIRQGNEVIPLLVRADPVVVSRDRALGFVLLFTDLTERKAAETARRRFQESVIEDRRPMSGQLDTKADLVFRNLLSTIVENAQLAALEIADGVDPAHMPEMLESIRESVARTARMLGYLVWHTSRGEKDR